MKSLEGESALIEQTIVSVHQHISFKPLKPHLHILTEMERYTMGDKMLKCQMA